MKFKLKIEWIFFCYESDKSWVVSVRLGSSAMKSRDFQELHAHSRTHFHSPKSFELKPKEDAVRSTLLPIAWNEHWNWKLTFIRHNGRILFCPLPHCMSFWVFCWFVLALSILFLFAFYFLLIFVFENKEKLFKEFCLSLVWLMEDDHVPRVVKLFPITYWYKLFFFLSFAPPSSLPPLSLSKNNEEISLKFTKNANYGRN